MPLKTSQNIIVAWFSSLGSAYLAVQEARESVQVLEIFPLGQKGHAIFHSDHDLQDLNDKLASLEPVHKSFIPHCALEVLNAYLSVDGAALEEGLLIVEGEFIGSLFEFAQQALMGGLKIMDLRLLRGASSASYLFLTGSQEILQTFVNPPVGSGLKVTRIDRANAQIKELFNLT